MSFTNVIGLTTETKSLQSPLMLIQVPFAPSPLPAKHHNNFVPSESCIYKTDRTLKMYSNSTMAVLGTCRVSVHNPKNKKKYNVEFVVEEGDYRPLIGSRTSQQMNLVTVQQENILQVTPNSPAKLTLYSKAKAA